MVYLNNSIMTLIDVISLGENSTQSVAIDELQFVRDCVRGLTQLGCVSRLHHLPSAMQRVEGCGSSVWVGE